MIKKNTTTNPETLWKRFIDKHNLNEKQSNCFKKYYDMLIDFNNIHNVTAITDLKSVLDYHFSDSLVLNSLIDCSTINSASDIGSGGGFPGIPLKIKYPHLKLVLIEVVQKKVHFLESIVKALDLKDVEIYDQDWRTFLRKTNYSIDVFCARASLQPEELVRVFKASSPYNESKLVYWASQSWSPDESINSFIKNEQAYKVGDKNRRLILLEKM